MESFVNEIESADRKYELEETAMDLMPKFKTEYDLVEVES